MDTTHTANQPVFTSMDEVAQALVDYPTVTFRLSTYTGWPGVWIDLFGSRNDLIRALIEVWGEDEPETLVEVTQ